MWILCPLGRLRWDSGLLCGGDVMAIGFLDLDANLCGLVICAFSGSGRGHSTVRCHSDSEHLSSPSVGAPPKGIYYHQCPYYWIMDGD